MSARSPAASKVPEFQKARLVKFVTANPILSSHKFQGQKERLHYKEKWTELTELLNGIENGVNLPTTAWQREWTMMKNIVKEKMMNPETKSRALKGVELTSVEEMVADFLSSDQSDLSMSTYPDSDNCSIHYRAGTSRTGPDTPQYPMDEDEPKRTPVKRPHANLTEERRVSSMQNYPEPFSPSPSKSRRVEHGYGDTDQPDALVEVRSLLVMQNKFLERIAGSLDEMSLHLRNISHSSMNR